MKIYQVGVIKKKCPAASAAYKEKIMFNNFKNLLIGVLSAVIVIAVGASAYNAFASPASLGESPMTAGKRPRSDYNCPGKKPPFPPHSSPS